MTDAIQNSTFLMAPHSLHNRMNTTCLMVYCGYHSRHLSFSHLNPREHAETPKKHMLLVNLNLGFLFTNCKVSKRSRESRIELLHFSGSMNSNNPRESRTESFRISEPMDSNGYRE